MSWAVRQAMDGRMHVMPVEDLRPHRRSRGCWCAPTIDTKDCAVIIHNSLDGREKAEQIMASARRAGAFD